jgi:hypothetical protein
MAKGVNAEIELCDDTPLAMFSWPASVAQRQSVWCTQTVDVLAPTVNLVWVSDHQYLILCTALTVAS